MKIKKIWLEINQRLEYLRTRPQGVTTKYFLQDLYIALFACIQLEAVTLVKMNDST